MVRKTVLVILAVLIFFLTSGCLKLESSNKGKLIVRFNQFKAIPSSQPARGIVSISKNGRTLQKIFDLPTSEIVFDSIEEGTWNIYAQLLDQNNYVLYKATEQVKIVAKQTNYCSLTFLLNTADLSLNIYVESDQVDSVLVNLSCDGEEINDQKTLEGKRATFDFNDMKSRVWDMRLTLFSGQATIMTLPETGAYGLELQPGRTNTFNVVIDRFGNLSIEFSVPTLNVVSSATLTNLEEGIKIEWNQVEGADSYDLYKKQGDLWIKLNSVSLEQCFFIDTNVTEGETYLYVINAKSLTGLQSGFSDVFSIKRDTKRVFLGTYEDRKVHRLRETTSGFEIVKSFSLTNSPFHIHTRDNSLYVVSSNAVLELDSTTLEMIQSRSLSFILLPADFTQDYLFLIGVNKMYRLNLTSFAYDEYNIQGLIFLSADNYLCTVDSSKQVILRDPSDPMIVIAQTNGDYAFTKQNRLFVYENGNMRIYTLTSGILRNDGSISMNQTPKFVDVYQDYAYVAVDDGFYVIDLTNFSGQKVGSLNLTRHLMIHESQLYLIHDRYLKVYDLQNPLSPTLIRSNSFTNKCWSLFVD